MALQNYSIKTVRELLKGYLYVPNYQREYSWEFDQLEDLWKDLTYLIDENSEEHFFGQVLIHNNNLERKKYIIDGQQRITTSVIFMKALLGFYVEISKNSQDPVDKEEADYNASDIRMNCIGRYSPNSDQLFLHLGNSDADFFRNYIQIGTPDETKRNEKTNSKSHDRIKAAYWYFVDSIRNYLYKCANDRQRLEKLDSIFNGFLDNFKTMYIEASELGEAFIIFETLNARGKDLETSDLLKNFILSKDPNHINEAEMKWRSMLSDLGDSDPTKYIRCYWNATRSFTREKALYRTICDNIRTPRESIDLMDDLKSIAPYYSVLNDPFGSSPFENSEISKSLKNIQTLKATSFHPVILAMALCKSFSEEDYLKVIHRIECLVFRNMTICKDNPNTYEVVFADLATKIYGKSLITADQICGEINSHIRTDAEFTDAFSTWSGKPRTKEVIRYIFRKIHKYLDVNNELNLDNSEVHIEHIMPEDASLWNVSPEIHDAYLWRLGNLALLSGPINISISNNPFCDKKSGYASSKIEPNKQLCEYSEWTETEINDRQHKLAGYAIKIWPAE